MSRITKRHTAELTARRAHTVLHEGIVTVDLEHDLLDSRTFRARMSNLLEAVEYLSDQGVPVAEIIDWKEADRRKLSKALRALRNPKVRNAYRNLKTQGL